ncbi:hypothetical protein AMECASPLE_006500 [Ameca splendens]|uniref:Uncharacterized protein n=1 Tax=Ameca splendens TaxID=208324 RepID=A0ABV0ZJV1_9TELE
MQEEISQRIKSQILFVSMCFPKTPLGFQEKHVQKETGWKSRGESREEGFKSQPGITKQQRAWGAARTPTPTPHCPDTASIPQPPLPSAQTGGEKKRPRGAAEQPIQVELRRGCSCSIQAEQDRLCAVEAGRKGSVGRAVDGGLRAATPLLISHGGRRDL